MRTAIEAAQQRYVDGAYTIEQLETSLTYLLSWCPDAVMAPTTYINWESIGEPWPGRITGKRGGF